MNGVGLSLVTISSILATLHYVHAVFTEGYTYYHTTEMLYVKIGVLTALAGFAAAIAGKGKVRISVTVVSMLNLLLWFIILWFIEGFAQ